MEEKVELDLGYNTNINGEAVSFEVDFPPNATDEEKIELASNVILEKYRLAFEELAK